MMNSLDSRTTSALVLKNYQFTTNQDIEALVKHPNTLERVRDLTETYYKIDIATVMHNLTQVGSLLRLAYAGSKTFSCSQHVVEILSDYQTVIGDSNLATGEFVRTCLGALKKHKLAIVCAEKGQLENAIKQVSECSAMAEKMEKNSKKLAKLAEKLCSKSKAALISAAKDETMSGEKRKAINNQITSYAVRQSKLEKHTSDLEAEIEQKRRAERNLAKRERSARGKAFVLKTISNVMSPVGSALVAPIETAATGLKSKWGLPEASDSVNKQRNAINKELEEINIELAGKVKLLEQEKKKKINKSAIGKLEVDIAKLTANKNQKDKALNDLKKGLQKVGTMFEDKAEYYQQEREKIETIRRELQQQEWQENAEINGIVTKLKNLRFDSNSLDQAVISLELSVKLLGKIKTVFENTRLFWRNVASHCNELKDTNEFNDSTLEKKAVLEGIMESALSWATLGQTNLVASNAMKNVNEHIDGIMDDLPDRKEAIRLVQELKILGIDQFLNKSK